MIFFHFFFEMPALLHDIPPFYQLQVGEESQHGIAGLEDLSPGKLVAVCMAWFESENKKKRAEGTHFVREALRERFLLIHSSGIRRIFMPHSICFSRPQLHRAKERTTCTSGRNSELSSCVVQFQRSETSKNPSKLDSGVTSVWHCQSIVNRLKELEGSESEEEMEEEQV